MKLRFAVLVALILASFGLSGARVHAQEATPPVVNTGQLTEAGMDLHAQCYDQLQINLTFIEDPTYPLNFMEWGTPLFACAQDGSMITLAGYCGTTTYVFVGTLLTPTAKGTAVLSGTINCWPWAPNIVPGNIVIGLGSPDFTCAVGDLEVAFDIQINEHPLPTSMTQSSSTLTCV